jgi:hypothetical protein
MAIYKMTISYTIMKTVKFWSNKWTLPQCSQPLKHNLITKYFRLPDLVELFSLIILVRKICKVDK